VWSRDFWPLKAFGGPIGRRRAKGPGLAGEYAVSVGVGIEVVVDQVGVAVGVELITELGCVSECIAVQRDAVGLIGLPIVVVVGVRTVGIAILVKVREFIH